MITYSSLMAEEKNPADYITFFPEYLNQINVFTQIVIHTAIVSSISKWWLSISEQIAILCHLQKSEIFSNTKSSCFFKLLGFTWVIIQPYYTLLCILTLVKMYNKESFNNSFHVHHKSM